jgi:transposase-like protein
LKERGVAQERRQYSREFKLMALSRLEEARNVEALAQELGVRREMLYVWRRQFQAGGVEALRNAGRPRPVEGVAASDQLAAAWAERRIAELERKGRPAVAGDRFFRRRLAAHRGVTPAARRAWRDGVFAEIQAMTRLQGQGRVERLCAVADVSRASYYRDWACTCASKRPIGRR